MTNKAKGKPHFSEKSELTRFVEADYISSGGRVSLAAFLPKPDEAFLSVNSMELELIAVIAGIYHRKFGLATNDVPIAIRKVAKFNSVARSVGIAVTFNNEAQTWEFPSNGGSRVAYEHKKIKGDHSHCGVMFISGHVDYATQKKIARRLTGKRPHLVTIKPTAD